MLEPVTHDNQWTCRVCGRKHPVPSLARDCERGHTCTANRGPVCPECRDGKHRNCTGWAIDQEADNVVPCDCHTCHKETRA